MHYFSIFVLCISTAVINLPSIHSNSGSDKSKLFAGKYHIPEKTPDPININTAKVHPVHLNTPFHLYASLSDKVIVFNNGDIVKVILDQKTTNSRVTGGILGEDVYQFGEIKYLWTNNTKGIAATTINEKGYPLENIAIFYNTKYGTHKNAMNYRDGMAEIDFTIGICPDLHPNPFFPVYAKELRKVLKAGTSVETTLGTAIMWFAGNGFIPPFSSYLAYPGSYNNRTSGQRYYSTTVIILPHIRQWCLSQKQYERTFGSFENLKGQTLTNTETQFPQTMPVVRARGILNTNTC